MNIGRMLPTLGRVAVTLACIAVAGVIGWRIWVYYIEEPWTGDAALAADVVTIAPDVSGLVSEVYVHDTQRVGRGTVLFRIDPQRFAFALAGAQASVMSSQAAAEDADRDEQRQLAQSNLSTSIQQQQKAVAAAQEAHSSHAQALANRDAARLNLERSVVRATVNGILTNFHLRPGDYVSTGQSVAALVDTDSFYVVGYFQETKLPRIHIGDPATVQLMGQSGTLQGHVEGLAGGIASSQASASPNLLPNVNPTFTWVRLAQRVPVRIALDRVPPEVELVAGRTATVSIVADPRTATKPLGHRPRAAVGDREPAEAQWAACFVTATPPAGSSATCRCRQ